MSPAREKILACFMYLSPLTSEVYLLFNLFVNTSIMQLGVFLVLRLITRHRSISLPLYWRLLLTDYLLPLETCFFPYVLPLILEEC